MIAARTAFQSLAGRTWVRVAAGLAISVVAFAVVLGSVDVARTVDLLRASNPVWIGVLVLVIALDVSTRALRWRELLRPIRRIAYGRVLGSTLVGYLANDVLPARLGELVRSRHLGDREGLSASTTLGTVVVERVVDTTMVVAIAAVGVALLGIGGPVATAVLVGAVVAGVLGLALGLGIIAHRLPGASRLVEFGRRQPRLAGLAGRMPWLARLAGRMPWLAGLAGRLRTGLAVAARPRTLATAIALSALAWAFSSAGFAAAGQALGISLNPIQAALLASGTALATAVPSGPGYLGTYELAAVRILAAFGVNPDHALALAVLAHATTLVATAAGGAISLALLGWGRRNADRPFGVPPAEVPPLGVPPAEVPPVESRPLEREPGDMA